MNHSDLPAEISYAAARPRSTKSAYNQQINGKDIIYIQLGTYFCKLFSPTLQGLFKDSSTKLPQIVEAIILPFNF
jgi:hypothetical protein